MHWNTKNKVVQQHDCYALSHPPCQCTMRTPFPSSFTWLLRTACPIFPTHSHLISKYWHLFCEVITHRHYLCSLFSMSCLEALFVYTLLCQAIDSSLFYWFLMTAWVFFFFLTLCFSLVSEPPVCHIFTFAVADLKIWITF